MIERVARAIWNIRREEEDRCDMELEDMGKGHSVWSEARAVIEAMREPTEAMTKAAVGKALSVSLSHEYRWPDYMRDLHRLQIDTALAPPSA